MEKLVGIPKMLIELLDRMEDYDIGNPHLGPRWPRRRRRRRRLLHDHSAVPLSLQAFSSLYKVLLDAATLRADTKSGAMPALGTSPATARVLVSRADVFRASESSDWLDSLTSECDSVEKDAGVVILRN